MNFIAQKCNSIVRYTYWHLFSKKLGLIQIAEYPKSGGTWMTQLVSEYLNRYYPRNVIPKFKQAVIHGHYRYSDAFNEVVYVVRDGRDIMISYYFHYLIGNDRSNPNVIRKNRAKVSFNDYENIEKNLPEFIEYLNTDYAKGFNKFSWHELNETYLKNKDKICIVKYEEMLLDIDVELRKVLNFLKINEINEEKLKESIHKFSFKNQTKRKPGEENKNSFLRKGISGDWKNYFTIKSAEVFDKYSGKNLIELGYETDNSWVKKCK